MSSRRTERLLNLVICLLATRRWLSKEQIRAAVPQYADCDSDEAFDRMFERDKEDLRELGVPLLTGTDSAWFDDEIGYRIDAGSYALPQLELTPAELAVLGLASRVWQQASLAGPAARAYVKLQALGVQTDDDSLIGVEPRVRTAEPAFDALYAATRDRAPVTFRYRKPSGEVADRRVEPWAVISRRGHWYLAARDRDRDAPRVFRLSRIDSAVRRAGRPGAYLVPSEVDPVQMVSRQWERPDQRVARLRVRAERGGFLRRRGTLVAAEPGEQTDPGVVEPGAIEQGAAEAGQPDWDLLEVRIGDAHMLAAEVAGHGPDVVVLEPEDLRAAVIRLLSGSLAAQKDPFEPGAAGAEDGPEPGGERG